MMLSLQSLWQWHRLEPSYHVTESSCDISSLPVAGFSTSVFLCMCVWYVCMHIGIFTCVQGNVYMKVHASLCFSLCVSVKFMSAIFLYYSTCINWGKVSGWAQSSPMLASPAGQPTWPRNPLTLLLSTRITESRQAFHSLCRFWRS